MSSSKEWGSGQIPKMGVDSEGQSRWHRAMKRHYDDIGNAVVRAKNWRIIAFALAGCLFLAISGLIYQSSKSTVVPYVIEIDSTTGMARAIGPAKEGNYEPKKAEIEYFLGQFIYNTRTVPLDPIVWKKNWKTAMSFLRPSAAAKMKEIMDNEKQGQLIGKETVQPNVVVMNAISENSYQIRWTEENYTLGGGQKNLINMTGVVTFEIGRPKDEQELKVNPIGIYIKDFSWNKDQPVSSKENQIIR